MIVYHGSNSRFETLRIGKNLVKHDSSLLNEGMGIYFSTDRKIAESYGKYLYTLEINDAKIYDMRSSRIVQARIKQIAKEVLNATGVNILPYLNIREIAQYVVDGRVAIDGMCREIYMLLDSNEDWYFAAGDKVDNVYKQLERLSKVKIPAYLFNYHIPNIGIIKTVTPDVVKIISREKIS